MFFYREVHIDSEFDDNDKESKYQESSNRPEPFGDACSNGNGILLIFAYFSFAIIDRNRGHVDWLENSMTQIDLFSRRHRGMLESAYKMKVLFDFSNMECFLSRRTN